MAAFTLCRPQHRFLSRSYLAAVIQGILPSKLGDVDERLKSFSSEMSFGSRFASPGIFSSVLVVDCSSSLLIMCLVHRNLPFHTYSA